MKKILKNRDVYTLPEDKKISLVIEAGAEVWIEEMRTHFSASATLPRKIDVILKPRSHLRWMTFSYDKKSFGDQKKFTVEAGAKLEYFHHILGNCEDTVKVFLDGDESSVLGQTIFFGRKNELQKMKVEHFHNGKNTTSKMISLGAVKDSASSHFYGNINMLPGCSGANGTLEEHNLLLSSGSKIEAIPALEIHHDEVQASHSATLERIDEEKLFYLKSRGLKDQEALELLVEGFFWDALQKCPNLSFSKKIFKEILKCL